MASQREQDETKSLNLYYNSLFLSTSHESDLEAADIVPISQDSSIATLSTPSFTEAQPPMNESTSGILYPLLQSPYDGVSTDGAFQTTWVPKSFWSDSIVLPPFDGTSQNDTLRISQAMESVCSGGGLSPQFDGAPLGDTLQTSQTLEPVWNDGLFPFQFGGVPLHDTLQMPQTLESVMDDCTFSTQLNGPMQTPPASVSVRNYGVAIPQFDDISLVSAPRAPQDLELAGFPQFSNLGIYGSSLLPSSQDTPSSNRGDPTASAATTWNSPPPIAGNSTYTMPEPWPSSTFSPGLSAMENSTSKDSRPHSLPRGRQDVQKFSRPRPLTARALRPPTIFDRYQNKFRAFPSQKKPLQKKSSPKSSLSVSQKNCIFKEACFWCSVKHKKCSGQPGGPCLYCSKLPQPMFCRVNLQEICIDFTFLESDINRTLNMQFPKILGADTCVATVSDGHFLFNVRMHSGRDENQLVTNTLQFLQSLPLWNCLEGIFGLSDQILTLGNLAQKCIKNATGTKEAELVQLGFHCLCVAFMIVNVNRDSYTFIVPGNIGQDDQHVTLDYIDLVFVFRTIHETFLREINKHMKKANTAVWPYLCLSMSLLFATWQKLLMFNNNLITQIDHVYYSRAVLLTFFNHGCGGMNFLSQDKRPFDMDNNAPMVRSDLRKYFSEMINIPVTTVSGKSGNIITDHYFFSLGLLGEPTDIVLKKIISRGDHPSSGLRLLKHLITEVQESEITITTYFQTQPGDIIVEWKCCFYFHEKAFRSCRGSL